MIDVILCLDPDSQRRNLSASIKAWWAKRKNVLEVEDAIP